MSTFTRSFRYPVHWGDKVVGQVTEKYARGTYNVARIFDTSPGVIRWWMTEAICSGHDLKFRTWKNTIKAFDEYGWYDLERMDKGSQRLLYRWIAFLATDDAMDENL